jgi:hypothetical protein
MWISIAVSNVAQFMESLLESVQGANDTQFLFGNVTNGRIVD